MGSVPMLIMMIAAAGVTYGWQPDPNGDSETAVQYIVQVSPYELERMAEIGEITSVIDPAVRGHVSRFVIRVGDQDLPRELPPSLVQGKRMASLKPDPQTEMSLPPSLQGAVDRASTAASEAASTQFDKAGRALESTIKNRVGNAFAGANDPSRSMGQSSDRDLVEPPSTRTRTGAGSSSPFANTPSTNFSMPSFANANSSDRNSATGLSGSRNSNPASSNLAQTRTGGPSTSSNRSNTWGNFGQSANDRIASSSGSNSSGRLSGGPSTTEPNRSPNGLRSSDLFGRTPGGNASRSMADASSSRESNSFQGTRDNTQDPYGRAMTQYEQVQLDLQRQRLESQRLESQRQNDVARNSPASSQPASTNGSSSTRRLTDQQRSVGGVAFDRYDRLVDQYGRPISDPELVAASMQDRNRSAADEQRPSWAGSNSVQPTNARLGNPNENRESIFESQRRNPANLQTNGYEGINSVGFDPNSLANSSSANRSSANGSSANYRIDSRQSQDPRYGQSNSVQLGSGRDDVSAEFARLQRERDEVQQRLMEEKSARLAQEDAYARRVRELERDSQFRQSEPALSSNLRTDQRLPQQVPSQAASLSPGGVAGAAIAPATKKRTTTPMFTWLLLISFFVNLYFLYWLHSLRQRFRDLAAAKRMMETAAATV